MANRLSGNASRFVVSTSTAERRRMVRAARAAGMTLSEWVRRAVARELRRAGL